MSRPIPGAVALVTGANRGIGRAIVHALLERGAARVYAGARDPGQLADLVAAHGGRVVALPLDITDAAQVQAAAQAASDVSILINNAGVATGNIGTPILSEASEADARADFEVNYFGTLRVSRAFAPVLAAHGGGAIVNLLSVVSMVNFPAFPAYSASKAALHSATQALRMALAGQGTRVTGVYPGPTDTDMASGLPLDKTPAPAVANAILDAVERGDEDVLPDVMSQQLGGAYLSDPKGLERMVAAM